MLRCLQENLLKDLFADFTNESCRLCKFPENYEM